jgi:transcriptional pleiotropic regulator of transition state genes
MKSTGVVRKIDELGRIVLPMSIRTTFDIKEKDALEIFTEGDRIILQKYQPSCVFCNDASDVSNFCGKKLCRACIAKIKSEL